MKIVSSDEHEFNIDYDIVKQSKLLKLYFDDDIDEPIRLPHIKASIFKAIVNFCDHHKNDPEEQSIDDDDDDDDDDDTNQKHSPPKQTRVIDEWDRRFVKQLTIHDEKLFDIIMAANYLGVKTLIHVLCRTYIPMIRGKTSEEIQELFKLAETIQETTENQTTTTQTHSKKK